VLFAGTTVGLQRSTDGGATWTVVRTGSIDDLAFKPGNP